MPASVTVPEIRPPGASAKSMPVLMLVSVTVMGVRFCHGVAGGRLSYASFTYAAFESVWA